MSAISQKSISGITSITTPAGVDNQLTLHTNNTNEVVKLDQAGNLHFSNHVNTTGVSTSSNFKTGSSNLHSTGLTVGDTFVHATGVNATSADIDDFIDVGNNIKLGNAGVITATSFVGDGSDLTNLPAGLGTALSSTQTNPLNKMYYTNQVLGIGATVTVDPPASAQAAYTQYADIKVDDDYDLIIAEGDDLIPDVLGLADFGTFGGGPSAGRIRVNSITNSAANGAPTVQNGLVISGVTTVTTLDLNGDLDVDGHLNVDNVSIAGVSTVTTFLQVLGTAGTSDKGLEVRANSTQSTDTNKAIRIRNNSNTDTFNVSYKGQGYFAGKVGIGTEIPAEKLSVEDSSPAILINATSATGESKLQFGRLGNTNVGEIKYEHSNNAFTFRTNDGADRLRIDSSGRLLINSSTVTASYGGKLQLTNSNFAMNSFAANQHAQTFLFAKSRGTSGSGGTIVQDGDFCGHIEWYADDGVDTANQIAKISAAIDGTPGANDTPGELLFYTTADGANASTEKVRIDSSGRLLVGTTNTANGHVSASKATIHGHLNLFKDSGGDNAGVNSHQLKFVTQSGSIAEIQATSAGAGGASGRGGYLSFFAKTNNNPTLKEMLRVSDSYVTILRENTSLEGGQLALARASDNTGYWMLDSYGSSSTPDFRIHAGGTSHFSINSSGQWVDAPTGTVIQVVYGRYDPNTDTYSTIASDTKARSPAYVDITPLRSDSKLVIQSKCHTRMQSAPGCSFGIDYSTNSGGSWTALSGMATRSGTALDFFYKGEALNHHYTSHITTYIDSFTGTRRFSPWGQGWGSGTWELSYGHGEHSITIFEIAT